MLWWNSERWAKRRFDMLHEMEGKSADTGMYNSLFVCPVCGEPLQGNNLVDAKSIVEDNLYYVGGVLIVSDVWLHCNFEHRYTEEGTTMENPHKLVAVVKAAFDKKGKCFTFDIVEVHPAEKTR